MEHTLDFFKIEDWRDEIKKRYKHYGVDLKIGHFKTVRSGERIIYRIDLKRGAKHQSFFDYAKDVQIALHLPYFKPIKDGVNLYLAIADRDSAEDDLRETLRDSQEDIRGMQLPYPVGYDTFGEIRIFDVYDFPHLIISGGTNMGKSVALCSLILSIAYYRFVKDVVFFLLDVRGNTLSFVFGNLPHLGYPIVKNVNKAAQIILWLAKKLNERTASGKDATNDLPIYVCVIDDVASFIRGISDKKLVKRVLEALNDLLQHGRHGNVHMILATQDPTKSSVNIDWDCVECRIVFKCTNRYQAEALGMPGAQRLDGKGFMMFRPPSSSEGEQLQGSFVCKEDAKKFVAMIARENQGYTSPHKLPDWMLPDLSDGVGMIFAHQPSPGQEQHNDELCRIIIWALGCDTVSAMQIKQVFVMGNRANDILEQLTELMIVADKDANKPRKVLPQCIEDLSDAAWTFLINNKIPEYVIEKAFREEPEARPDYSDSVGVPSKSVSEFFKKYDIPLYSEDFKIATDESPRQQRITFDLEIIEWMESNSNKRPILPSERCETTPLGKLLEKNKYPTDEEG